MVQSPGPHVHLQRVSGIFELAPPEAGDVLMFAGSRPSLLGRKRISRKGCCTSSAICVGPDEHCQEKQVGEEKFPHAATSTPCNEAHAPTAEMVVTPPSIRKSAPTT
jgi:hypothetical protein